MALDRPRAEDGLALWPRRSAAAAQRGARAPEGCGMSSAAIRLFPGNAGDPRRHDDADGIAAQIDSLASRHSRLMGSAATAALLANLARTHHLRSVPRGVRR